MVIVQWRGNPIYPPLPAVPLEKGGRLRVQSGWPCLWPLRGVDPVMLAARSLELLARIDHRAARLLAEGGGEPGNDGGNGPQPPVGPTHWDTGNWDTPDASWPA